MLPALPSPVWTERMTEALAKGVKGGKWFSLIDKVYDRVTLSEAFRQVKANRGSPGIDHQTVEMFDERSGEYIGNLARMLREKTYVPRPIKRVWIPKPGSKEKRPLGIPTVRDRVVQTALRLVIEPIFEHGFAEHSYGFRPGRGSKDALRRVDALLKQGYVHVVDADIKGYFDAIDHDRLMILVETRIADSSILELVRSFLKQSVMETAKEWTPETGSPQGAVISPLLSNIYLDPFDHLMEEAGFAMVRYADDWVVLCDTPERAEEALATAKRWMGQNKLTLHPEKTRIVDTSREGFDFLGYHFERGHRWPSRKSTGKLKDAIRAKTKRTNGNSLSFIVASINRTLVGWFEYFKHGNRFSFPPIDGWIRMRLRSILRKRLGKKGRGRGSDHQRWKNAFFAAHGLFSLTEARLAVCRSRHG